MLREHSYVCRLDTLGVNTTHVCVYPCENAKICSFDLFLSVSVLLRSIFGPKGISGSLSIPVILGSSPVTPIHGGEGGQWSTSQLHATKG